MREGLGIETRARRLAVHWRPHLDATRAAQERWIRDTPRGHRLAVLGAGRLLDLSPTLVEHFDHLRLVDADPLAKPFWRAAYRHEPVITDVTGCLADWTARLIPALDHIRALRAPVFRPEWLRDVDAIVSLNLLSQIVVGWQDRVREHSHHDEEEWLEAMEPSARSLVDAHLAMLNESGADRVLLITDLLYLDYKAEKLNFSRRRWSPPPVRWEDGQWRSDTTTPLECTTYHALCGLDQPVLSNYRQAWSDRWLWHIRPQGTEPPAGTGTIHLVGAFAFQRR